MAEIKDWDVAAGNNNDTAPDGFPENMNYSDVNNAAREVMAVLARWYGDTNGSLVSGGSSNAYTLTPNRTYSAYAVGMDFTFEANHSNTAAATLNVSTLGAKAIKNPDGTAVASGAIKSGGIYRVIYDGTNFLLTSTDFASTGGLISGNLLIEALSGWTGLTMTPVDDTQGTSFNMRNAAGDTIFSIQKSPGADATASTFTFYAYPTAGGSAEVVARYNTDGTLSLYENNTERGKVTTTGFDVTGALDVSGNAVVDGTLSVGGSNVAAVDPAYVPIAAARVTAAGAQVGTSKNIASVVKSPTGTYTITLTSAATSANDISVSATYEESSSTSAIGYSVTSSSVIVVYTRAGGVEVYDRGAT
jgi:hypothetical protein